MDGEFLSFRKIALKSLKTSYNQDIIIDNKFNTKIGNLN